MATAMASVLVEIPPPPPPSLLLPSSLVLPPVVSVVAPVFAAPEPDSVEVPALEADPPDVEVLDAWSWLLFPSLVTISLWSASLMTCFAHKVKRKRTSTTRRP